MVPSRKKNNFRDHGGGLDAAVAQFGGAHEGIAKLFNAGCDY